MKIKQVFVKVTFKMSTCHQAHNIPWDTFTSLLEKIPGYNTSEDSFSLCFTPDPEGAVFRRLAFFASKISSAIKQFSATERSKYDNTDIDNLTELYSAESANEWLPVGRYQSVSGWLSEDDKYYYDPLDPLKELFIQDKCSSLLHLARKGFPIEKFQFATYSNFFHYGLGRLKEDSLTLYIHLNILLALGTLQTPDKWHSQWREFLQREILTSYDGNQMHVHMYNNYFQDNPKFEDMEGLQALLKRLFRMMYVYDMVLAERNVKVSWENEVLSCLMYFLTRVSKSGRNSWWEQYEAWKKTHS